MIVLIQKIKQSKGNVSKKTDMSPGNDHYTTMTQNSEPVQSKKKKRKKKERKKEKKSTTSQDKKNIYFK